MTTIADYARQNRIPVWMVMDAASSGILNEWIDEEGIRADTPRELCLPSSRMKSLSIVGYAKRWGVSTYRLLNALLIAGEKGVDYWIDGGRARVRNIPPDHFRAEVADIILGKKEAAS